VNKGLRKASVASFEVESCNFEESKPRKPKVQQPPTCDESFPNLLNMNHASYNMHFGTNLLLMFVGFFLFICIRLIALLTLNNTKGFLLGKLYVVIYNCVT